MYVGNMYAVGHGCNIADTPPRTRERGSAERAVLPASPPRVEAMQPMAEALGRRELVYMVSTAGDTPTHAIVITLNE